MAHLRNVSKSFKLTLFFPTKIHLFHSIHSLPDNSCKCTCNCHVKSGLNINVHLVFKTGKVTVTPTVTVKSLA